MVSRLIDQRLFKSGLVLFGIDEIELRMRRNTYCWRRLARFADHWLNATALSAGPRYGGFRDGEFLQRLAEIDLGGDGEAVSALSEVDLVDVQPENLVLGGGCARS